jgi:hypothetical protein
MDIGEAWQACYSVWSRLLLLASKRVQKKGRAFIAVQQHSTRIYSMPHAETILCLGATIEAEWNVDNFIIFL